MYGGKLFSRIFHVPDKWREAVVWNCSCVYALKGTVLHRTVPRGRVSGKPIRNYAERSLRVEETCLDYVQYLLHLTFR